MIQEDALEETLKIFGPRTDMFRQWMMGSAVSLPDESSLSAQPRFDESVVADDNALKPDQLLHR